METTATDAAGKARAVARGVCGDLEPLLTSAVNEAVRATLRIPDSSSPRDRTLVALERVQAACARAAAKLRATEEVEGGKIGVAGGETRVLPSAEPPGGELELEAAVQEVDEHDGGWTASAWLESLGSRRTRSRRTPRRASAWC